MEIALSVILIITSLVMILLVLLHKGKGGGLSDLFGGGVSSTLGSSSVVERNLDRITIFFGVLWFVLHRCSRLAHQPLSSRVLRAAPEYLVVQVSGFNGFRRFPATRGDL